MFTIKRIKIKRWDSSRENGGWMIKNLSFTLGQTNIDIDMKIWGFLSKIIYISGGFSISMWTYWNFASRSGLNQQNWWWKPAARSFAGNLWNCANSQHVPATIDVQGCSPNPLAALLFGHFVLQDTTDREHMKTSWDPSSNGVQSHDK